METRTGFVKAATLAAVPEGGMLAVDVGGLAVVVCNVAGEFYAVHDECTHECFPLSEGELEGHSLICPLHGACFDVRSGEVLSPPAYEPVRTYEVRVEGEDVFIAGPTDD
jgi:3-phenylpropionate/trans-cinnamate dioxygenase ferredoxin subunit